MAKYKSDPIFKCCDLNRLCTPNGHTYNPGKGKGPTHTTGYSCKADGGIDRHDQPLVSVDEWLKKHNSNGTPKDPADNRPVSVAVPQDHFNKDHDGAKVCITGVGDKFGNPNMEFKVVDTLNKRFNGTNTLDICQNPNATPAEPSPMKGQPPALSDNALNGMNEAIECEK